MMEDLFPKSIKAGRKAQLVQIALKIKNREGNEIREKVIDEQIKAKMLRKLISKRGSIKEAKKMLGT